MQKFVIGRETTNGSEVLVKPVAQFDSLQEAMDALYRGARRYGYEVAVDNSIDPNYGFCLWQIYVRVGRWVYRVTQEDDSDPFAFLV